MKYSTESKHKKYLKCYEKLMDTATKTLIDAVKTVSKRVVQRNC